MSNEAKTFEDSMARLEEIVKELQNNEKPLDEMITLFEEGLRLVNACNTRLNDFETQINEIVRKNSLHDNS
ncbi:MAG: exodeoxyribonuclease VII small subunit [Solobacterium sp.]|nr:exodeoxyribonuclease VII small subunit [Solobacterium sp.]